MATRLGDYNRISNLVPGRALSKTNDNATFNSACTINNIGLAVINTVKPIIRATFYYVFDASNSNDCWRGSNDINQRASDEQTQKSSTLAEISPCWSLLNAYFRRKLNRRRRHRIC